MGMLETKEELGSKIEHREPGLSCSRVPFEGILKLFMPKIEELHAGSPHVFRTEP